MSKFAGVYEVETCNEAHVRLRYLDPAEADDHVVIVGGTPAPAWLRERVLVGQQYIVTITVEGPRL